MEVTKKNVKRQEAGRKAYQTHLQKVKEDILKNNSDSTNNSTSTPINSTNNSTSTPTSTPINSTSTPIDWGRSTIEDIYHYGTLPLILTAIGLIFWFQKKKPVEKKTIEKKRRGML